MHDSRPLTIEPVKWLMAGTLHVEHRGHRLLNENIGRLEHILFPGMVARSKSRLGVLLMKNSPILMNPHLLVQHNYTRLGDRSAFWDNK